MCGIAGLAAWRTDLRLEDHARAMTQALVHRGPDGGGLWLDPEHGIALGHRRLAIIDLSPSAAQPMTGANGRHVIAYNGEIYNYRALRRELDRCGRAPPWRSHSDTEVLLAAIAAWGVRGALDRVVGMFAFALWDRVDRSLTLARDRLGEKPLYYGEVGGRLCFASELHALRSVAGTSLRIDRAALAAYLQFGYVPAPLSIHEGIAKLEPGHVVTLRAPGDRARPEPYWTIEANDLEVRRTAFDRTDDRALLDGLHDRLGHAVADQLVADVPLGAFLSGGIDSSLLVALMQSRSSRQVRTFTIGFRDTGFDEAPHARAVARHLGTDHTELYIDAVDAAALVPELPRVYDEPFADSSQIPTLLVARMTRRHVTVALSGDGGDELFAGYPRYALTATLWRHASRVPRPMRRAGSAALTALSPAAWDRLLRLLRPGRDVDGRRLHTLARLAEAPTLGAMYTRLMSRWPAGRVPVRHATVAPSASWPAAADPVDAMRLWDLHQYLPDDLLVKVDRAAMNASLETRAPFLDHRVVEFAVALPHRLLLRDGVGKWCLRHLLARYLPPPLFERPKAGFEVPLASWLRGPLRDWAAALLEPRRLEHAGLLDGDRIATAFEDHLNGRADHSLRLWAVLMFQAWTQSVDPSLERVAAAATPSS